MLFSGVRGKTVCELTGVHSVKEEIKATRILLQDIYCVWIHKFTCGDPVCVMCAHVYDYVC